MGNFRAVYEDLSEFLDGNLDAAAVRAILGVAAALAGVEVDGRGVNRGEWVGACACAGARYPEAVFARVLERLVALSIAARGEADERWQFVSAEVVRELAESAAGDKRLRRYHGACARALSEIYADATRDGRGRILAGRRALHLIAARRVDEALEELELAQKVALDANDYEGCLGWLQQREQLLDQMQVAPLSPMRAHNDTCRAQAYFMKGDTERAEALLQRGIAVLRRSDWASETGYALLLYAKIRISQGRYAEALRYQDDASGYLAVAGDVHGLTRARANKAHVMLLQGQYEAARAGMLRALESFEALGDQLFVARLHNFIARSWLGGGDIGEAKRAAERSRALSIAKGYRATEAGAWMMLGEIARRCEQWDQARHYYVQALEVYPAGTHRPAQVGHYNIALVEIGAQNYQVARPILIKLVMSYLDTGMRAKLPLIYAALMTCAVGRQDWEAWEENRAQFERALLDSGGAHEDIAWLAERMLGLFDALMLTEPHENAAERKRLAQRRACAYALACTQNEQLGNRDKLHALRAAYAAANADWAAQPS